MATDDHTDERGSVIAVSDASGVGIGVNRYDEYGIPAATNLGRFQFTGQAWLPELGLYYYKARMYSPRFGSRRRANRESIQASGINAAACCAGHATTSPTAEAG